MAFFAWTDPNTGIRYTGPEAGKRMVAYYNMGPAKGLPAGMNTGPPPPVGTYDPTIDYNAGGANRGYQNTFDDGRTAYTQGQEDFGVALGDLTRGRDRNLTDIGTAEQRQREDFDLANADTHRQYDILGRQQAGRAAQQGIQSAGLLAQSAQARSANQQRDLDQISLLNTRAMQGFDTARNRTNEDFDRGKLGLDLTNARQFGGAFGNTIINPLTGQPQVGSLLTSLTRAGDENTAFQNYSAGQRAQQAAANGYVPPGMLPAPPGSRTAAANAFVNKKKAQALNSRIT